MPFVSSSSFQEIEIHDYLIFKMSSVTRRLFKKSVQQGRSERRGESYFGPYVEPLSDARTKLAGFFNSLLYIDYALGDPPSLLISFHGQFRVGCAFHLDSRLMSRYLDWLSPGRCVQ